MRLLSLLAALIFVVRPFEELVTDVSSLGIGQVFGIIAVLIWGSLLKKNLQVRLSLSRSFVLRSLTPFVVLVYVGTLTGLLSASASDYVVRNLSTLAFLFLFAIMVETITKEKKYAVTILWGLVLSGVLASIPAILFQVGIDVYAPFGAKAPTEISQESLRAGGIGIAANSLAAINRGAVFGGFTLLLLSQRAKYLIVLLTGFAALGLLLTASRTNVYSIIIFAILVLFLSAMSSKVNKAKVLLVFLFGFGVLGLLINFIPDALAERIVFWRANQMSSDRAEARVDFTREQQADAVDVFLENPLFGVGLGQFVQYSHSGHIAHDITSILVAETGVFGILTFLYFMRCLFRLTIRNVFLSKVLKPWNKFVTIVISSAIVSFLTSASLGGGYVFYDRMFWCLLGLLPNTLIWAATDSTRPIVPAFRLSTRAKF